MYHMHDVAWMIGREDPGADRNRAHLVALREAKTTTEYRAAVDRATPAPSTVGRLALVGGGTGSTVDLAACCA